MLIKIKDKGCIMQSLIKKQVMEVAKLMYDKGLVNAFEGNISARDNNLIYITPSATCKGFLTEEMLVVTDREGHILEGNLNPSTEIKLHLAAYMRREDIGAVVHAHSPFATAYAIANKPIETKAYPELITFFGKVPLAKYGTPSTDEIVDGMVEYINEYDIILLANHGVIAVGKDVYDAFFKLEAVEAIAKTLTISQVLGGEKELPQEKLEELYAMANKKNKNKE